MAVIVKLQHHSASLLVCDKSYYQKHSILPHQDGGKSSAALGKFWCFLELWEGVLLKWRKEIWNYRSVGLETQNWYSWIAVSKEPTGFMAPAIAALERYSQKCRSKPTTDEVMISTLLLRCEVGNPRFWKAAHRRRAGPQDGKFPVAVEW